MPVNLKGRSFLTLKDFTPDEIRYMLNLAADLKAKKRAGIAAIRRRFKSLCFEPFSGKKDRKWAKKLKKLTRSKLDFD